MIDNIDRLLTQLANHDNAIDTIDDNLANGTVRRTRISEWTLPNGETGRSVQKIIDHQPATDPYPVDELVNKVAEWTPPKPKQADTTGSSDTAFVIGAGDFQIGKGIPGGETAHFADDYLRSLASAKHYWQQAGQPQRVHIAFLGDMIEGYVSQGGNNAWRTQTPLTEQIRLTRMAMMQLVHMFDHCANVTVTSIPGNHGEAVRFGKGVTTYDDSFDVDCCRAIAEAYQLTNQYPNIHFHFPERDEMTTTVDVAGTQILHAHGHQWRNNQHYEWWRGQEFHNGTTSHILMAGHRHHLEISEQGQRTFIQCPSMEGESVWYRHRTGTTGNPGLVCYTINNKTPNNYQIAR